MRLTFAFNALGLAVWFPRIPDVKALLEVDLLILSFCFFMAPLGTMIGFFAAPAIIARWGVRQTCRITGPIFILMFIPPALAGTAIQLGTALLLAGLTIASIEVAMNAKAVEVETTAGRRIMASCHGFWSLGSMLGALLGGAFGGLGISFLVQQVTLAPLFALLAYFAATALPPDQPGAATSERPRLSFP